MELLNSRVLRLAMASVLTGILVGVVGGAFRYLLMTGDKLRDMLVVWAHAWPYIGWLAPVVLGLVGAGLARILVVRFAPQAEGSGIQRVEAVFSGEVKPAPDSIVLVKFFGGLLAMGSGLALGREGPTVQMGASLGALVGRFVAGNQEDQKVVDAAGAGAGLAVAFNAPIGGSVFVFEELTSSFTPWLLVATLAAASMAVWLMRLMLGNALVFNVPSVNVTETWRIAPSVVLGALLGATGAFFNFATVALLRFADRLTRYSSTQRAMLIGAVVGLIAWFAPALVGGGESITQAILSDRYLIKGLLTVFLVRLLLSPWSYAARAPGGIFAPLLVLGACSGALFANVLNHFVPALGLSPVGFAVIGMAGLFTASVRAPLTGVVLSVEMTGRGDLTLGLLAASLAAMVVAMLLKSEPIYESLKRRMLAQENRLSSNATT
ncbi:MAG: ClC family H(+)/Cl(-) exchange transporter [Candidatus Korobacteraceae bacterium]